ncbi:phosphotransferase [Nocardia sp. NPDC058705]|uniref:phosphotransferase n=1 Tax=Nocardia sp. NPDC058705 TaxID=3346609 RepID=UPI0036CBB303
MAEYTRLEDLDQDEICARYDLGEVMIVPVPGGAANSSFRVHEVRGKVEADYALTVLDNDPASAPRLASLMEKLANRHFETTELIHPSDSGLTVEIDDRVMILKRWIEGNVYPVLPDDLLGDAGAALAGLHALPLADVIGDEPLPAQGRRLTAEHRSRIDKFTDREFVQWLTEHLAALDNVHSGRSNTLIHGDLYSDNIIVGEQGTLHIIDWETACIEDPLLDLGMAIIGLGVVDGRLVRDRAEAIIDGYSSVLPITQDERTGVLRKMVELSALIIAYHRYHRHNVRYPGSPAANKYREMIGIVKSLDDCALHGA